MKTGIITAAKQTISQFISPKKAEKVATNVIKESGAAKLESAQDAMASQGKAMVKPYVKPNMEVAKVEEKNMRASSDRWDGGDESGRDDYRGSRYSNDIWDEGW